MPPQQQNPNPDQPQQPYQPPQYGVNSTPQQSANGGYDVVPTPSVTGHSSGHNPYEFIFNPDTQKRKAGLLSGNQFLQRILLLVGGLVILLVVAGIILSVALPSSSSTMDLTAISQRQQELVRIATLGKGQAEGQTTKNFAMNVLLSVQTSQNETTTYLLSHGTKLSSKTLGLGRTAQTDTALSTAQSTSTFDVVMTQVLTSQLTTYQSSLKTAYTNAKNTALKNTLQKQYTVAALLLKQAKATS